MNRKTTVTISLTLLLFIAFATQASAISSVNTQPATQKINMDGTFIVYLNVTPGTNIAGIQTNIKFNKSIIRIDSIQEGNLFNRNNRSTFFSNGIINNTDGTVINIFDVIIGTYSINTSGTFIKIYGTPLSRGTSNIELYNIKISKPDGTAESVSYTNGMVVITYPSWDVNEDGITDILDLTIVANHFGEYTAGRWDVNGIPPVDISDLVITSQHMN